MRTRSARQAGFTLLELLIALTLLILITGAVVGGLGIGRRAWETTRADESRGEVEATARSLSEWVSRAYPAIAVESQVARLVFTGRRESLAFVALSEGEAQRGGLVQVEIGLDGPAGKRALNIWSKVFRVESAWAARRAEMNAALALADISSFEISYFGIVDPQRPQEWRDDWIDRDRLPELIAFRFVAMRQGRRFDIPLIARIGGP